MIHRISVGKIIGDHLRTLRSLNDKSSSLYWGDVALFFVFPLFISMLLVYFNVSIRPLIGELIKAIAIFAAFLFNMLAIIYNSMNQIEKDAEDSELKKVYVKEIHSNLSFNILTGIVLILTLLATYSLNLNSKICFLNPISVLKTILSWLLDISCYFLILLFFLTLLMNLNRVYVLLNRHIRDKIGKKK